MYEHGSTISRVSRDTGLDSMFKWTLNYTVILMVTVGVYMYTYMYIIVMNVRNVFIRV